MKRAYDCAQLQYTIQNRTGNLASYHLRDTCIAQVQIPVLPESCVGVVDRDEGDDVRTVTAAWYIVLLVL